jgi:hypothetical protein
MGRFAGGEARRPATDDQHVDVAFAGFVAVRSGSAGAVPNPAARRMNGSNQCQFGQMKVL